MNTCMTGDISLTTSLIVEENSGDQQHQKATSISEIYGNLYLKIKPQLYPVSHPQILQSIHIHM